MVGKPTRQHRCPNIAISETDLCKASISMLSTTAGRRRRTLQEDPADTLCDCFKPSSYLLEQRQAGCPRSLLPAVFACSSPSGWPPLAPSLSFHPSPETSATSALPPSPLVDACRPEFATPPLVFVKQSEGEISGHIDIVLPKPLVSKRRDEGPQALQPHEAIRCREGAWAEGLC